MASSRSEFAGQFNPTPPQAPPCSRVCVAILVIVAIVDTAWIALTPLQMHPSTLRFLTNVAASVVIALVLARYFGKSVRLRTLLNGIAFLLAAWPALRLFNHLTTTIPFPLADAQLASWDRMIGFDWLAYVRWVDQHPALLEAMSYTYTGLTGYTCLLFLLLALVGPDPQRRCAELIELFVATALVCMIIGIAFPALAPTAYYAPPPGTFEHLSPNFGTGHVDYLSNLRENPSHEFHLASLPGLVTLPSFHTAMGVIAIYCARGSLWFFLPMLVVNLLMIGSTPVFGSHYGVDIIAGALVTGWVILARLAITERRGRRSWLAPIGLGPAPAGIAR